MGQRVACGMEQRGHPPTNHTAPYIGLVIAPMTLVPWRARSASIAALNFAECSSMRPISSITTTVSTTPDCPADAAAAASSGGSARASKAATSTEYAPVLGPEPPFLASTPRSPPGTATTSKPILDPPVPPVSPPRTSSVKKPTTEGGSSRAASSARRPFTKVVLPLPGCPVTSVHEDMRAVHCQQSGHEGPLHEVRCMALIQRIS